MNENIPGPAAPARIVPTLFNKAFKRAFDTDLTKQQLDRLPFDIRIPMIYKMIVKAIMTYSNHVDNPSKVNLCNPYQILCNNDAAQPVVIYQITKQEGVENGSWGPASSSYNVIPFCKLQINEKIIISDNDEGKPFKKTVLELALIDQKGNPLKDLTLLSNILSVKTIDLINTIMPNALNYSEAIITARRFST